jgi:hypothetical protein
MHGVLALLRVNGTADHPDGDFMLLIGWRIFPTYDLN